MKLQFVVLDGGEKGWKEAVAQYGTKSRDAGAAVVAAGPVPGETGEGALFAVYSDTAPPELEGDKKMVRNLETVFPEDSGTWLSLEAGERTFGAFIFIEVVEGSEEKFIEASIDNATNSQKEEGIVKFDLLRDVDSPSSFVLREIYVDESEAPALHKETAHYARWRDTVADMMAKPRSAVKFGLSEVL